MEEGIRTMFSFIYKVEAAQSDQGQCFQSLIVIGLSRTHLLNIRIAYYIKMHLFLSVSHSPKVITLSSLHDSNITYDSK
jgi:hypothetical protein